MASTIDPTLDGDTTADGRDVRKAQLEAQLEAAKGEIEGLQSGADLDPGAITAAKLFGNVVAAPAAVSGVVTITPADDRLLYSVSDAATVTIKVETPAARRPVLVINATGNTVDVVDAADATIRAGVPDRHTVWLDWTGSAWAFAVEWSQRLHRHVLADISDAGTAAAKDVPATGDAAASEVVLGDDSRLTDARAPLAHTHDAADIDSGTLADARVAQSNVTQHQGALSITESQISDLSHDAVALRGVSLDGSIATPADGDVLVYRSVGDDWVLEPKPEGGSNPALNDVTDVTISSPADDEVLAFDAGSGEWINQTPIEAGLATAGHTHGLADITDSGALAAKDTVATADLDDDAVGLAKLAHGTADVLLGFDGSGAPAEITAGQGIAIAGAAIAADVASVFGRTGAVSAQAGDYDGLPLDLQDAPLTRPTLTDYSETSTAPSIASGALTLDLEAGNVFDVVLTEDVSAISLVNPPASGSLGTISVRFRQDATGGRTVDLSAFDFGNAPVPAMPATATTGRLWITALTVDGGTTWEAMAGFEKG